MIQALSLAFLLAIQGSPAHADLHPAEADVYVELGDLSTVLPALDGAPPLRLLRDERVTKLLEGNAPQGSLKDLIERGLASAAPATKPEGWLPGMKTSSLSRNIHASAWRRRRRRRSRRSGTWST